MPVTVMALELFAIFANSGYFPGPMTLCIISLWLLLLITTYDNFQSVFTKLPRLTLLPILLFFSLWIWTGLSIVWSIAPDLTWNEFNRTGGYFAAFLLGIAVAGFRFNRLSASLLFAAVVLAASLYGLGVKALPSVIDNLDESFRVSVPAGYANAQGLASVLAVPFALYFASVKRLHWAIRLAAVITLFILLLTLYYTFSRGAMFALFVGIVVLFIVVPMRLRLFFTAVTALAPTVLIAWWSYGEKAIMQSGQEPDTRIEAAYYLRWYILAGIVTITITFMLAMYIGRSMSFTRTVTRVMGALLFTAVLSATIIGTAFFVTSKPSFGEWASQTYQNFKAERPERSESLRLLNLDASGRWQLWEEAVANWKENTLTGTGAQSFPLVHLIRRDETTPFVKQPHGLPFRLLSELGLIGFLLGVSFIVAVLVTAALNMQKIIDRWQKGLAGTMFAVNVTYLTHTLYDWDWNLFALTMPFFFFSGVLVGWRNGEELDKESDQASLKNQEDAVASSISEAETSFP